MPVLISLAVVDIMDAIARAGSGDDDADEALSRGGFKEDES